MPIPLGILAVLGATGAPVGPNWLNFLSSSTNDQAFSVSVDSSGNMYVVGRSNVNGDRDFLISKYNSTGVIQWQRRLGGASEDQANAVAFAPSGNIYVVGYSGGETGDVQIAKYSDSGTIQWQRRLHSAGSDERATAVAIDSSENVYVAGHWKDGADTVRFLILKYNSSGTIQWQRRFTPRSGDGFAQGITIDSSGDVYVVGFGVGASGSEANALLVLKYNSSGTLQWQRSLASASFDSRARAVTIDSSNNIYVVGSSADSGTNDFQLAKYNSSGTIQWQRRLGGSGADVPQGVSIDSSNNIYIAGYSNSSGTNDFQLAKYDSSGTIQWQRRLVSTGSDIANGIAYDSSGNICVVGSSNSPGNDDFLISRLPDDGTKTGTYSLAGVSFTYEATSLTDASTSLTDAAAGGSSGTTTLTDATTTLTDASTTLTSTTIYL